jgi:ADP-heptose:LPS heptosyltransferase
MWPLENVAALADALIKKYKAKVVFIGTPADKELTHHIQSMMVEKAVDVAGQTTVRQAAELTRNCDIVVSNDSGTMHLAAAMGTKTIGLFGPNTPNLWAPYGKKNVILFKPKKGCPFMDNMNPELLPKELTTEQMTCMDAITVDDVLKAVERLR